MDDRRQYVYPGKFLRAIDGVRIEVEIDLGFDMRVREIIRLDNVWVPPLVSSNGQFNRACEARALVDAYLSGAIELQVHSARREGDMFFGDILFRRKSDGKWHSIRHKLLRSKLGEIKNASE